jgi:hypothetical protein
MARRDGILLYRLVDWTKAEEVSIDESLMVEDVSCTLSVKILCCTASSIVVSCISRVVVVFSLDISIVNWFYDFARDLFQSRILKRSYLAIICI